ncbi:MAG: hypothetical protein IB617_01490 [Candidatus Nealsonbacteria bacterium]|nr:MAG: hypothetical protein IB617_01490 [Candidatus Nealsonbacteria bacterium]
MTENQLIKKIKRLKAIKPRRNWVLLNKKQILGEERRIEIFPFFRPVYAGLFCLLFLAGLFEFSQNALPGEFLYYLKKITERSQLILSSEEERPGLNLELVNKRLEELNQIAQNNEVRKLAPALKEYQASVFEAVKSLTKITATTSDSLVIKGIAEKTQKLEENKEILGTLLEIDEKLNPVKVVAELLIKDMEKTFLTEEDEEILEQAKQDFENGNYSEALERILLNQ